MESPPSPPVAPASRSVASNHGVAPNRSDASRGNAVILGLAGLVAVIAVLALLAVRARQLLVVHHDTGGVEPNIVYGIQTLLASGKLYYDPSQPPYSVIQYSPLYYYFCAGIAWVARVSADDVLGIYTLSRVAALGFNLLLPGLLYAIVRLFDAPKPIAALTAAWGFSFIYITDFGRPDSLYHALSLASTYYLLRHARHGHEQPRWLYASIGLAVLATFTKQSGIVLLPLITSYLFWKDRSWTRIGAGLALYFGASALLFVSFAALNGGMFPLWENVIGGIDNGIDLDWFFRRIVEYYARELAGWGAIIAAACVWLWLRRGASYMSSALILALAWQLGFGFVTALKWGSMPSYFSPFLLLGFCALAVALFSPGYRSALEPRWATAAFSAALVLGVSLNVPVTLKWAWLKDARPRFDHASEVATYLRHEKRLQPADHVMTLVAGELTLETTFLNNLLHQNALFPQKDVVTCCAFKRKRFDYSRLQRQIDAGLVKYLIKGRDNKLDAYAGARLSQFKRIKTLHEFDVYEFTPD